MREEGYGCVVVVAFVTALTLYGAWYALYG